MIKVGFEYREIAHRDMWVSAKVGEQTWGMPLAAIKTIILFWVFCSVCFFAYAIGKADSANNTMITAFLAKGGVKTFDGGYMFCEPTLNEHKELSWDCRNTTVVTNGSNNLD